ncbi:DUF2975 domain-containing protein [Arthrobacter sp. L77]|uniref:DUF2975 domain-containing protein n=1 Tax=Arthrobacter sp. L77 TaxID=1496689 RepID=UPI0005B87CF3|nr:DUF2975 domain-containing protein [Arthrobacter sp. L77]
MTSQQVSLSRIVLGILALGALLAQFVMIPRIAKGYANTYPEVADLASPYVIVVAAAIGGFEVALLAAWQLLAAYEEGSPSGRSKRWIDGMAVSLCLMALLIAGICVHAGSVAEVGGPAMLFGVLGSVALIAVVGAARSRALASVQERYGGPLPR